jgi:hypothetical protein
MSLSVTAAGLIELYVRLVHQWGKDLRATLDFLPSLLLYDVGLGTLLAR